MAVVVTAVETKGNLGRVYDVTMGAADTDAVINHGLQNSTPDMVTWAPNGADFAGCYSQQLRLGAISGTTVTITKGGAAAASFRVFIQRSYVTNAN